MGISYNNYTFVEAFKIMRDNDSYGMCWGYPYICMYQAHTLYASCDEGTTFELLYSFPLWMEMCKEPFWVISKDMKTWRNKNNEIVVDLKI